jgi:hypothetical protein
MPKGYPMAQKTKHLVLRRLSAGLSYGSTSRETGVPRGTVAGIARSAIVAGRLKPRAAGRPNANNDSGG